MLRIIICSVLLSIFFIACEKGISFNLKESAPQLVVDASIENAKPPVVILSTSLNYFSSISLSDLQHSFVHGAVVSVSNGVQTQLLKEYAITAGNTGDSAYYYTIDSTHPANVFYGEINTGYTLSIDAGGRQYSSTTFLPSAAKKIDSLWWQPAPANSDTGKTILMGSIFDPPGYGDYIRYFTSVNNGPFLPGLNSVYDDQITDGTTYDIQIEKGVDRNQKIDMNDYSFFKRGDTVMVKFCNIDKATYDFWRTMEYNYQSIGNPFSSPTQVLGNISNGALGYFGGYGVEYISLVIPK